jgi:hypothetical protein
MRWERGMFFAGIGVFLYLTILAGIELSAYLWAVL